MENETKSREFYLEKEKEETDPSRKAVFGRLAEEEKKHYFLLENIVAFISRPDTWIENAEFNHLNEY